MYLFFFSFRAYIGEWQSFIYECYCSVFFSNRKFWKVSYEICFKPGPQLNRTHAEEEKNKRERTTSIATSKSAAKVYKAN